MSRYYQQMPQLEHNNTIIEATLAYGFDHVVGYFYQIVVADEADPVESQDSFFDGLSHGEMLARFDALNVRLPRSHRVAIALDLPF